MPRDRYHRLNPSARDELLRAASTEFATHGLHSASINRVLETISWSKGSFYYTFEDKEDLFLTVVREHVVRVTRAVGPPGASFWGWVRQAMGAATEEIFAHPELWPIARDFYGLTARSERANALLDEAKEWIQRLLSLGRESGAIRVDLPLDLLVNVAFSMGIGLDRYFLALGPEANNPALISQAMMLFQQLLSPPDGEQG